MFEGKKYADCLFFCHLALEKTLKSAVVQKFIICSPFFMLEKTLKSAVVQKTREVAPYIHDLRRLTELAGISLGTKKERVLDEISAFNIAGRYPEEKLDFYKSYNKKAIAERYLQTTNDLILWLKKKLIKK
ncbi:MAG: HEPN domain-containing protein [Patescibacteria group bacterium]|nr:HEPN domain-containing protein [Patescibacteria group bacterium]